ncbi:hypothetical protein BV898_04820 [Hypsibius exemplaris]|uniref:Uncharacterized protein n=1 Tax=Hypsibius exemplaris TaxID=2072580 RepID=A0A1W0X1T0_HYPEX|nr:hypothetical protein BV898_04820 [Hypsibius exemplaris]
MKIALPPFRFFAAWFSFGVCVSTGITCLFYIFGIGKTSDLSSTALQRLDYSPPKNPSLRASNSHQLSFDLPPDCANFAEVVASITHIRQTQAALRVSLYSSGVHWATNWSHQTFGLPVYLLCLSAAFIALAASIINCFCPPSEEMSSPLTSGNCKVRKIRMRVPQKNQRWSGYIYTHLYDDREAVDEGKCKDSKGRPEDDTLFDREALKFLQRTISTCGSREQA